MSEALPLISVVIPVYNRANTLLAALQSVFDQTLQDFEIIVVDDGSSDDPEAVVRQLNDPRVRYTRQDNQGANVARNLGISLARGKWIALLDSDDRFLPHHLSVAYNRLKGTKSAYFSRVIVDRGNGSTFLKPPRGPKSGEPLSEYLCCDAGFVQTSTLVLPSQAAKSVQYLDWLPYGQDVDYALRLDAAGVDLVYNPNPGAVWDDVQTGKRISSASRGAIRDRWAEENRHLLTRKAYAGFRGWRSAKAYAEGGQTMTGLRLYAKAAAKGAYSPRHAARVGLQVLLAGGSYQRLVKLALKFKSAS
ncbi:glycosyltransferase [Novosphingobium sp. RD2P27]|uniref:Glycosyltransferase n=1 Tax=Novosphingobium kalidii TaxID=3230299 RepID=A0ABV2CWM5_9SPHN